MELRRMRYFIVLAEELHFGRAAARLNIVQPALSQQIRLLEDELDLRLFDRSSRQVALTDAGKIFEIETRKTFEQVITAQKLARDANDGLAGDLTVGFVDNAIWTTLPGIILDFRTRYPRINLDLQQMTRHRQTDALKDGDIDVGIMPGPIAEPKISASLLLRAPLHVCMRRGHQLENMARVPIAALVDQPFVSFASSASMRRINEIVLDQCVQAGFTPRLVQPVQQMLTALALVSAGVGVAFVPEWMVRAWTENVSYRPLDPPLNYDLMIAHHAECRRRVVGLFSEIAWAHMSRWSA